LLLLQGAEELVQRAMKPQVLCYMEPTWQPWY
jgi:hypothetical protein